MAADTRACHTCRFYNTYPCIIITAKGQPDVATRWVQTHCAHAGGGAAQTRTLRASLAASKVHAVGRPLAALNTLSIKCTCFSVGAPHLTAARPPPSPGSLFLRKLKDTLKLPVLALVDSDPYGLKILSVYMKVGCS